MPDPTPALAGSPAPHDRPWTPGWVKLGIGLAVIGGQITESVLHPQVAEILAIADAAIPLVVGSVLFITIVRGRQETVDRIFRLLRWIKNQPEPTAPHSPNSQSPEPTAFSPSRAAHTEHPPTQIPGETAQTPSANPAPSSDSDLINRQAAALTELNVPPEQDLSRAQVLTAFTSTAWTRARSDLGFPDGYRHPRRRPTSAVAAGGGVPGPGG
jgi:hypothetical protein